MTANELRKSFLDFFSKKFHKILPSAPMVIKNDPTLMFTNAGMNQFKDIFLGNVPITTQRVVNSQKCLRVSGKHNDLEEVGYDTYHHTMFEMLGNWSFGDYFKKEAIEFAWEYLTEILHINKELLYVTIFEGNSEENVPVDEEAYNCWKKIVPENRILKCSKKDNFWEMGDTGPCGPCSEIHIDLRDETHRKEIPGENLVNQDNPQVIEIWNLVFIQFNRKADGTLVELPQKHVDTGMGFERLCRVIQKKSSNYDTDIFQPIIQKIAEVTNIEYGKKDEKDVAMRVIADHIRTICFSIADGQLPSNNKAGYVIRRILRRAVRYAYTFLNVRTPFMENIFPALLETLGDAYPELEKNETLIKKVIFEEEDSFLRTLATGINLLDKIIDDNKKQNNNIVDGKVAFELYDTFGFPLDLTELILKEHSLIVDKIGFDKEMEAQKERARKDSTVESEDWIQLCTNNTSNFIGYDHLNTKIKIIRYRKVKAKNKELYQLVFDNTPFFAESGGQIGDIGYIETNGEKTKIIDTKIENNLFIHVSEQLPSNIEADFIAVVDSERRQKTANNHTATHLLHKALREILGNHVEQKGSLVHSDYLRFDFSHFEKVSEDDLTKVARLVNSDIRKNLPLVENREIPIQKAKEMGAMALFGEKYGDTVRTISFGDSCELCGGTHVKATGEIGFFKIISEGSIAAGIRRIEAVSGLHAEMMIEGQTLIFKEVAQLFKNNLNIRKNVENLLRENSELVKQLTSHGQAIMNIEQRSLLDSADIIDNIMIISAKIKPIFVNHLKEFAFKLRTDAPQEMVAVLGVEFDGKATIAIILSESLIDKKGLNAVEIIKTISKEIGGGGGGQPFFATAGGKNPAGIEKAIDMAVGMIKEKI
ncbi:MAG: alanine--tRNA ligase [Marinilabiliaceae bacterium]|nr:alanine--tRNA ligase [Marinilabiliaceae bacterium]